MKYMLQKTEKIFSIRSENTKIWIWEQMIENPKMKEIAVFNFFQEGYHTGIDSDV